MEDGEKEQGRERGKEAHWVSGASESLINEGSAVCWHCAVQ